MVQVNDRGDAATRSAYPFTAIVGQEDMKRALCLNAVQPGIGGVLISGERGTAKTTAVRALPEVLGGGTRVVELPLNATEDRVVGTLHVGTLMKTGERTFVPGVLAEADGNILYVDEINLLEDHIVDLLLDAAATGVCRIEREGVSQSYPARFVLVGTMNPEEGTLRPQLLDRFGLFVRVDGSLSAGQRLELVRRQVDFERDPEAFRNRFEPMQQDLARQIAEAAKRYPQVRYPDEMAQLAAGLCSRIGVDGYRADITLMRAARAAAALEGRDEVTADDVLGVAKFVLGHRVKRLPFEETQLTEEMLQKAAEAQLKAMAAQKRGERDADEGPMSCDGEPGADDAEARGPAGDGAAAESGVQVVEVDGAVELGIATPAEGADDPKALGRRA